MAAKKTKEYPIYHKEQYYIKRGRKYIKVNDPGAYEGLGEGAWMVIVEKGCTSIRTAVNPKLIELDVALRYLEDGLCKAMSKASEMRPKRTPITLKEQKAWKAFRKTMGVDMPSYFYYASFQEIASHGCDYIKKIMLENNMNMDIIKDTYRIEKKQCKNPILDLGVND